MSIRFQGERRYRKTKEDMIFFFYGVNKTVVGINDLMFRHRDIRRGDCSGES